MAMPPLRDLANKLIFQVHLATIAAHIANFQEFLWCRHKHGSLLN